MIKVGKEEVDLLSKKVKPLSFEYLDKLYTIDNCEYLKADGENLYGVFEAEQERKRFMIGVDSEVLKTLRDESVKLVMRCNRICCCDIGEFVLECV